MKPLESRVNEVPHYPSLARALQNDMIEAAMHIRNALYNLPIDIFGRLDIMAGHSLKASLEALDFPHFIPIDNTSDALIAEYEHLRDIADVLNDDSYEAGNQASDIHDELARRGFWVETVLADMTAVVMRIENEKFNPIENTSEALLAEYNTLNEFFWDFAGGNSISERNRLNKQINDIFRELTRRNFFTMDGE